MSGEIRAEDHSATAALAHAEHAAADRGRRIAKILAFDRIGGVYVWIVFVVVFTIWVPSTFPTLQTVKQTLDTNAITGLGALALTVPLAARVFDLSVAYTMSLAGSVAAYLYVNSGIPLVPAVILGILVGSAVGVVNAIVVVWFKIDSFIGTLATGFLVQAVLQLVTNGSPITSIKLSGPYADIGQHSVGGITMPVFYMLAVLLVVWYLLEHTATGTRLYATGFNPDAARLSGVKIDRLRFMALIFSGTVAGATGIALSSSIATGDPNAGTPYLLPAFAAAFVGATQFKRGRPNAWGVLLAIVLLGTGLQGLTLATAPAWTLQAFNGVVLIAALAVTQLQRQRVRRGGAATTTPTAETAAGAPAPEPAS